MIVNCAICGDPLRTVDQGVYRYVEGWEKNRDQGGTNALRLRKPHDSWAHGHCVDAKVHGREGQSELDFGQPV